MRVRRPTYVFGAMRQSKQATCHETSKQPAPEAHYCWPSASSHRAVASTCRNPQASFTSMSQQSGGPLGVSSRNVRQENRVLRRHTRRQAQQRRSIIIERGLYFSALPILLMLIMVQRSWNERSDIEAYLALMPTLPPVLDEKDSGISRRHSKAVASKEVSKHKTSDEKRIKSTEKRKTEEAKHKDSTTIAPPKVDPNTKANDKPKGKAVDSKQVSAAHKADKKANHEPKDNEVKGKQKSDATQMEGSNHVGREGLAEKLLANIDRQFSLSSNATAMPNCLDSKGPQPVILMSLGRSGSSSTWQVLGSLTGQETKSVEYTGSSRSASIRFFEKIGPNDNGMWVLKYMCFMQQLFPKAGVVGFKWKPNRSILSMDASVNGLKLLGKQKNPSIKVVRSRRNLLDVLISRYKHKRSTANVPAHCRVGDKACLEKQLKAGLGVELPTYKLLSLLKTLTKEENDVDKRLKEYGVPRISASFEKLYYSDDASEWRKILQFLSPNAAKRIGSISDVRKAMQHQATSHPSHKKTIRNFDEVRKILNGTKFEKLLRP